MVRGLIIAAKSLTNQLQSIIQRVTHKPAAEHYSMCYGQTSCRALFNALNNALIK